MMPPRPLQRQTAMEGGFNGRTNKLVDGCYSFWQGGLFPLLQRVAPDALRQATLVCVCCSTNQCDVRQLCPSGQQCMAHLVASFSLLQCWISHCKAGKPTRIFSLCR
jgi:hypothetical protein